MRIEVATRGSSVFVTGMTLDVVSGTVQFTVESPNDVFPENPGNQPIAIKLSQIDNYTNGVSEYEPIPSFNDTGSLLTWIQSKIEPIMQSTYGG
jgi:hypothetical protein